MAQLARLEPRTLLGCFPRDREVIGGALGDDAPIMVVEDDARFGPSTFPALELLLRQDQAWDVLLIDVNPLDMAFLTTLARDREAFAARRA